MRQLQIATAVLLAAQLLVASGADAQADDKCAPETLSATLHERMAKEGKSDAEIREILDSSLKRRVLRGRVADGSGCTADQAEKALDSLADRVKQG